jgi:hypothetical protein
MKKVVELILRSPGSSACIERTFSRVNCIWSQEKSGCFVDTIQAISTVKTNVVVSCEAFSVITVLFQPAFLISARPEW